MHKLWLLPLVLAFPSCAFLGIGTGLPEGVECVSLTGEDLRRPELNAEAGAALVAALQLAEARAAAQPNDEEAAIWHGRRLAYLGRYNDAVAVFTKALIVHPTSHRLLRHRGHRYITLRRFEEAVADLGQASRHARKFPDRYEEDGTPNELGIPRSTERSNIEYHLGLAHYLRGEFEFALAAWKRCLYFSRVNDDMFVAATYWNVLTLWRLKRDEEANAHLREIYREMDVIENFDYLALLLLYKGEMDETELVVRMNSTGAVSHASLGFGLGAWHLAHGRTKEARSLFREVVEGDAWAAFGAIAAEVEVSRD